MPAGDKQIKSSPPYQEEKDLCLLLKLINVPASKQQLPSLKYVESKKVAGREAARAPNHSLQNSPTSCTSQHQSTEVVSLESFSLRYKDERQFSSHLHQKYFLDICTTLTKNRLCSQQWLNKASTENILRVLMCLRILLRDSKIQMQFLSLDGIKHLAEYFRRMTEEYLYSTDGPLTVEILTEMTNVFSKLSASEDRCESLINNDVHKPLVRLLSATDVCVLHSSLYALIRLAQSQHPRTCIGQLNAVEMLLRIIQEYDTISKKLAANLLRHLCANPLTKEQVRNENGVPLLLSQLHSPNVNLLWHVVWCLVLLCDDVDCRDQVRQMGGIPLILSLLNDRQFVSERAEASTENGSGGYKNASLEEQEDFVKNQYQLKQACCAALTELVHNDANAQQIVQANGIFSLGRLILSQDVSSEKERKEVTKLQQNAFRALRHLFSMERNRRPFKHLFPPELYEMFIDVGHYNRDLKAYKSLTDKINSLSEEEIKEIRERIDNTHQNRKPIYEIGEYSVFELLGTGAFGSVYRVRKKTGRQSFLALKELNLQNMVFGKNAKEKACSVGQITNELKIMKEEMRHPNVVRYYKTFELNDKLYIVMELIEGAHLGEHFNSLKEKKETFKESRIWNILVQLMLALRYLHKEKRIVHRDLTPNNIMLGENDKVTITDFGLAKQKIGDCSKMTSVVGTILYSCPEVVQSQDYGEKADIWALGCILYQMCMLEPPFNSNNMLTLVNKIVAGEYKPIPTSFYSARLIETIQSCLTVLPEQRPDILKLSGQLADILLVHMDKLRISQIALERKLDRERKRTQKHYLEANQNMQNYHRLFMASQEGYDKLTNLAGSGGAEGLKQEAEGNEVFTEVVDSGICNSLGLSVSSILLDASDEDSYPSSGSESRESSAGSVRSHRLPSFGPNLRKPHPPRHALDPDGFDMRLLEVDTSQSAKTSRDSGVSSGDPSPNSILTLSHQYPEELNGRGGVLNSPWLRHNIVRSHSNSEVTGAHAAHKLDKRSRSAALLTISPNRLREINDPIQQILQQLHKLIYITQLPPTLTPNPNRRTIEQYKRALFAPSTSSMNLKGEMKRLVQGSQDIIDLDLGPPELIKRSSVSSDLESPINPDKPSTPFYDPDYKDVGISYEYLHSILEAALEESGYYKVGEGSRQRNM